MKINTLVRRCMYCRSIMGTNVHIEEVCLTDLIVVDIDFETQQVPETTGICEHCIRTKVHKAKPQEVFSGLA